MLLRLVLPLSQFLSLSNMLLQFFFFRFSNYNIEKSRPISLTLSFPLAICLSRLCRVRVCAYGCLAVGLGIAILVGMWLCMYVDVNECNVCSVFMFLIWDFGFSVSYCRGICSEPLWF